MRYLWIFLGGGAGAVARYALGGWILRLTGSAFPWGTLAVNALGSLLLGALMHLALATDAIAPELRIALAAGLLGGFTTYSSFNYETIEILREGSWAMAAANIGLTVLLCLAAGFAGLAAARWLAGN
ncbi:MAG: fluoride efflux transporter CrcB [Thermoanaerobaculia bacterium]